MEEFESYYIEIIVWYRIRRSTDRPSPPPHNKTQQNLRLIPSLLPNLKPQPNQPPRNSSGLLPSNLPPRIPSKPETIPQKIPRLRTEVPNKTVLHIEYQCDFPDCLRVQYVLHFADFV